MLLGAQNGYTADEIAAALQGVRGSRNWTFRYDLYNGDSEYVRPLDNVLSGQVDYNSLADVKRSGKFRLRDDGTINFAADRIKPYVRLGMEAFTETLSYDEVFDQAVPGPLGHWRMNDTEGATGVPDSDQTWGNVNTHIWGDLGKWGALAVTWSLADCEDNSGNGRDGVMGHNATPGQAGLFTGSNGAILTKRTGTRGQGTVRVEDATFLEGLTQISFGGWAQSTDFGSSRYMMGWNPEAYSVSQPDGFMGLWFGSGRTATAYVGVHDVAGNFLGLSGAATAGLAWGRVTAGEPFHVAVTWKSGYGVRIYLNGVDSTASQTNAGLIGTTKVDSPSDASLYLGDGLVSGTEWGGLLDDMFITEAHLSQASANRLYQAGARSGIYRNGYVEWPQGLFLLSSPSRATNDTGVVLRDVDAYDQLVVLQSDKVTEPYYIGSGDSYTDQVTTLLDDTDGIASYTVIASSATLPVAKMWDTGTTKLTIINDLLAAINYEGLFFDEEGVATARPYLALASRAPEYTYDDGSVSVLFPEMVQTLDLFSQPNTWVLVVSDPDRTVLRAEASNDNPDSPISTVTRGRVIVDVRTEQDAVDLTRLQDRVDRLAQEASMVFETVKFSTGLMPVHQHNDTFRLAYAALGVNDKYSETSWSYQLTQGATMQHSARKVVSLS